jgi:Radical SAM superfamily
MLLIHPPAAKPCEPPAGIARLAGTLKAHNVPYSVFDANLEGLLFLTSAAEPSGDPWSRRACRNRESDLAALRSRELYTNPARYRRAVADINHLLELGGKAGDLAISLCNYQQKDLSPTKSGDLLRMAQTPHDSVFFPWFSRRLAEIIDGCTPAFVGFSLNYLSQALTTFAMIGWIKQQYQGVRILLGGGLVTSWMSNPSWKNPFAGLVDHCIAGPGEASLLMLVQKKDLGYRCPDYTGFPLDTYLAPGFILPYAASSGCYWRKCSFCPEDAEDTPYIPESAQSTISNIRRLTADTAPVLLHFLDNAVSPALMKALAVESPGIPWYGFARIDANLADPEFCRALRRSGCRMLKLGIESGDQDVLDTMNKGTDLDIVSRTLRALEKAGIATYIYLLFGTPAESLDEARKTLSFVARHHTAVTFLNLAIFNLPITSSEASTLETVDFHEGDLSLYTNFIHPRGWDRRKVRAFLDREFRRHPRIAPILANDPPFFTSNHAPFFCLNPDRQ